MIELTCPNCRHRFPVMAVDSKGFCKCGMDFELDIKAEVVHWKPDPAYTPDAEPSTVKLRA